VTSDAKDPFSRANYRSLIAWPARIEREAPFLDRVLADLPERSVIDLGSGTGEHSRHLASRGFRVVGLDASESMIADAIEEPVPERLRFVLGDLREADRIVEERFGAAICLGNTLPFLNTPLDLRQAFLATSRLLLPRGRFLFQVLNYEKLRARGERFLPLNFRPSGGKEIVFVRMMEFKEGGRVLFFPTTLELDSENEEPVRVARTKRVELMGWTRADLLPALEEAGFPDFKLFGTMTGAAFEPLESPDLIVQATAGS
jgi:SAM-dependent methyltransferase